MRKSYASIYFVNKCSYSYKGGGVSTNRKLSMLYKIRLEALITAKCELNYTSSKTTGYVYKRKSALESCSVSPIE